MRVSWIIGDTFTNKKIKKEQLKEIGPTWGGWKTWRSWGTDNVLCHGRKKAKDLIKRAFQSVCNLYLPNSIYADLERPFGVYLYEGDFPTNFEHQEEIIAMHLVADNSDLVLLLGLDLTLPNTDDKVIRNQKLNYIAAFVSVIKQHPDTQWVLIDYEPELQKELTLLNLTKDSFDSVIKLLN
jgi:hypothetical protein